MDPFSVLWESRNYLIIVPVLSLLMLVHELGHFITARLSGMKVEEFGFGFPPRIVGKEVGGIIYSLNWIPLGAFVRILGEDDPKEPGSFASKPFLPRFIVLAAGSGMNFLLAVALFATAFATGWPTPSSVQAVIVGVQDGAPAQAAGLQAGDVILRVSGQPADSLEKVQQVTRANAGGTVPFLIDRQGEELTIPVTLRATWPNGAGPLGVQLRERPVDIHLVAYPILESVARGWERATKLVTLTLSIPALLIQGAVSPEQARPISLPGMTQLAGQAATESAESGTPFPLLTLMAAFSAGLAVANLLPLPGLDGGRLLFLIIEAVRGRRIAPERAELVHAVGIAILLALMGVLIVSDIVSPPPPVDWGVPGNSGRR
ncbi:MAG TPA: M50 family metallopeptidase [Chloroflexota bacterium]|nr:M50 family metallopeptidase [Chloroflexota bacterium]